MWCYLIARHYMWTMQSYLVARHYICELCNAMLFSQSSYMWIISCYPFLYYVFHLSTTFVYSTTLPVQQPFEAVMEVSGVKTRYTEQTMLLAEANILLVTESSSEEDSETDDQSYFPLRSMLKLGRVILPMSCMLSCIAYFLHHIWIAICLLAYYINHIFELYHAIMFTYTAPIWSMAWQPI